MSMNYNIAFIIGHGRSGTHMLAGCLDSSPDTIVNIERGSVWKNSVGSCRDYKHRSKYIQRLIKDYSSLISSSKLFIDKSHTNLWNKKELAQAFPRSIFISIYRGPLAVVSSMLEHKYTAEWCREWEKCGIPNPFTGVTLSNQEYYASLPIESRCAMKWLSHHRESMRINGHGNVISIMYEDFVRNPRQIISDIHSRLDIRPGPIMEIYDTRNKWRDNLADAQVNNILNTIRAADPDNMYLGEYAEK